MATDVVGTESFTNGAYQTPSAKDTGDIWTDVLEALIDRITTHTHSGADSNKITLNIEKEVQLLVPITDFTWVDLGSDIYEATIVLPLVASFDSNLRSFFYLDGVEYKEFFPTVIRIDNANMKIQSNKNGVSLKVIYV